MDAGSLIRSARERSGLSRRELARRAGTSASTLAAYEADRSAPSVATLERVLAAAGSRLEVSLRPAALDEEGRAAEIERLLTFADEVPLNRTGPLRYPPLAELQR